MFDEFNNLRFDVFISVKDKNAKCEEGNEAEVHDHEGSKTFYTVSKESPKDVLKEKLFKINDPDALDDG